MSFDNLRIHAIIPDGKTPESVLVDANGEYPGAAFDPERHRTLETVVHKIGHELGAQALSVTMRKENTPDGHVVYRTKVPREELVLPEGYVWRLATEDET